MDKKPNTYKTIRKSDISSRTYSYLKRLGITELSDIMQLADERNQLGLGKLFYYNGLIYEDIKVRELSISAEALNILTDNYIVFLSQLAALTADELISVFIGKETEEREVRELLEGYLAESNSIKELSKRKGQDSRYLPHDPYLRAILNLIRGDDVLAGVPEEDIEALFSAVMDHDRICAALSKLESSKKVLNFNGRYFANIGSFDDDLDKVFSERNMGIFEQRMQGKPFEAIASGLGITKERTRQIEKNIILYIIENGPVFEDRYRYFYNNYNMDKSVFSEITGKDQRTYNYVSAGQKYHGTKPLIEGVNDPRLYEDIQAGIHRYLHRDEILIDGRYRKVTRKFIEDHIIRTKCKDTVTLSEFFVMYNDFLKENGLDGSGKLKLEPNMYRTRENSISASYIVLWKKNKQIRYYDIEAGDYKELLETLNLEQYKNVRYSALKFFRAYPELMERYDIRDEYELHNLLRKLYAKKEGSGVGFGKMPMIDFGEFDRNEAVTMMMIENAPISDSDLANMIYEEYGVKPYVVKANWLGCISRYYDNGIYRIDDMPFDENEMKVLSSALTEEFYYTDEVREIYTSSVPNADLRKISAFNMRKLGFSVYSKYMISDKFDTSRDYFVHILTKKDDMDLKDIAKRYSGIVNYSLTLIDLKSIYEIVEVEPYRIMNIKKLKKLGVTPKKIKKFCDEVCSRVREDEYFTIGSLRNSGFVSEFDGLGFKDWFFSSLLREDKRLSYQKMGKTVVFYKGKRLINRQGFIADMLNETGNIGLNELVNKIDSKYNVHIDRWDILIALENMGISYDKKADLIIAEKR